MGLIGAGGFGIIHLEGYQKNPNCELVSVASRTFKHTKNAADKFNIPKIYIGDEWHDMLRNENLDVVSICTPNFLHAPMTIEAIDNNINILCEKPICISNKQLIEVEKRLKTKELIFFTSFQKRYISCLPLIKKIIANEIIGKLLLVDYHFSHYGPYKSWQAISEEKWFFNSEKAGGGVLLDLGVHCIDLLRYLVGEYSEIKGINFNTHCIDITNEDTSSVLFNFQNDVTGMITVSWCLEPLEILKIYGTKGIFNIDLRTKKIIYYRPIKLKRNPIFKEALSHKEPRMNNQYELINHFITCVLNKKQDHPDFHDGKKAVEFVLKAYSLKK
ncbi:MAG: Gfo/Idh/MocA family protein [Candidatus Odinarchaeota archaeon]